MSGEDATVFKPNARVLAYHGPLIYEAKVIKIHEKNKTFIEDGEGKHQPIEGSNLPEEYYSVNAYFVHYKGWKAKWDEWVGPDRILEYNETNVQAQKELKEQLTKAKIKPKVKTESSTVTTGTKKRGMPVSGATTNTKKKKTDPNRVNEVSIFMKPELKYILVDDWEFITKERKVINIPSSRPVTAIISDYLQSKKDQDTSPQTMEVINEILQGLELYFNKSLSLILLYKFERLQYMNLLKEHGDDLRPSELYGVEHLLRLFVALPGLIAQTTMDSVSIGVLVKQSKDILEFITDNLSVYLNDYVNVSPAYDSLARS